MRTALAALRSQATQFAASRCQTGSTSTQLEDYWCASCCKLYRWNLDYAHIPKVRRVSNDTEQHTQCTCTLSPPCVGLPAPGEPIGSRTIDIWLSLPALPASTAPMAHCPLPHIGSSSTYKREVSFRVATRSQDITESRHQRADACSLPVVPR